MSTSIFSESGTAVKVLKDQLSLNDTVKIRSGTDDPRAVAKEGAQGSLYLQTGSSGGKVFRKLDSGSSTNWTEVGSGAGGINYIVNPDAEAGTTGWATYADAAGAVPVDGTGGTPTVTLTASNTSPLRGLQSFLLTKDAADRQGQGASVNFTIDSADKSEVMVIEFDHQIASGTMVVGESADLRIFVYDDDANVVLTPVDYRIETLGIGKFKAYFQSSATSTNYRLIFHVATTSALAWAFRFDNVRVGPKSVFAIGAPTSDWQSYNLVVDAVTTAPTYPTVIAQNDAKWRRVGDSLDLEYNFNATSGDGVEGSGTYLFPIPANLSIDPSKLDPDPTNGIGIVGVARAGGGPTDLKLHAVVYDATRLALAYSIGTGLTYLSDADGLFASPNVLITIQAMGLPILGWGSQLQTSADADLRVIAAQASGATAAANATPVINTVIDYDTHNSYNTTTGEFTCPVSGYYEVEGYLVTTNGSITYSVAKNGTDVHNFMFGDPASGRASGSITIYANAGDLLTVVPNANTGAIDPQTSVSFKRVPGPAMIAANELVAASYNRTTTQSTATATVEIADFDVRDFDTHGAVTTGSAWKFTAPATGKYLVNALIFFDASPAANRSMYLYKNNAIKQYLYFTLAPATGPVIMQGSALVHLNASDYIDIRVEQGTGGALTIGSAGAPELMGIQIHRVGF